MNTTLIRFALPLLLSCAAAAHAGPLAVHVTDSKDQPVADAIVYAEPEAGGGAVKAARAVDIEQKARKFIPLVSVIQTGTVVNFPNYDTVRHHIYSFSPAKKFDQKLYSGVAAAPVTFDKAGTVVLGCNIHDKMVAYVLIVDTPWFGKTDAKGKLSLDGLPAGKYKLKAWHYGLIGAEPVQALAVRGSEGAQAAFKLNLKPLLDDRASARPNAY